MRIDNTAAGALLLALLVPAGAGAQDAGKATEILAAARQAIGDGRLAALRALSVEATMQREAGMMQMSSEVELLVELPDRYLRSEHPTTPGVMMSGMTTGFNGDKPIRPAQGMGGGGAFVIRMGPGGPPPSGPSEKLAPEEQERLEKQIVQNAKHDLSRLMLGWFATAHPAVPVEYSYVGEAESPDGRAWVVDATSASGFAARLFVDQATKLPLMVTYRAPARQMVMARPRAGGGAGVVRPAPEGGRGAEAHGHGAGAGRAPQLADYTLYFDEWRTADGVRFPHRMRRAVDGETVEEWTIGKVKINPAIDPKKFEVKG